MDTLAYVGRGYATFSFIALTIVGGLMITLGVLMLVSASKGVQPSSDPTNPPMSVETKVGIGIGAIAFGIIFPLAGWYNRKLTRGNDKYAAVSGAFDIFNLFKGGRR